MSLQKITIHPVPAAQPVHRPAIKPLVMIADDSPTIRKIVEIVLCREGYEVIAVPDGVEALRSLLAALEGKEAGSCRSRPGQVSATQEEMRLPDLILLDIEMPRLDGYQVALSLRKRPRLAHIPLVMLSRRSGVVDRLKARLAGVRGYLTKPFTEQDLRALVAAFIGPAHHHQAHPRQPGPIRLVHSG